MKKLKCTKRDGGYGWSRKKAHEAGELYRVFLFLCARYPGQHILDRRSYLDLCLRLFGEYLHHFPRVLS